MLKENVNFTTSERLNETEMNLFSPNAYKSNKSANNAQRKNPSKGLVSFLLLLIKNMTGQMEFLI